MIMFNASWAMVTWDHPSGEKTDGNTLPSHNFILTIIIALLIIDYQKIQIQYLVYLLVTLVKRLCIDSLPRNILAGNVDFKIDCEKSTLVCLGTVVF